VIVGVDGTVTWRELWDETAARIGGDAARPRARWLCEEASGYEGTEFADVLDRPATQRTVAALDRMVARYLAGEPLQYVLGSWTFRSVSLMVDRRVLIPRPETEQVVEVALGLARSSQRPLTLVDLGTGSGAIALSLAAELPLTGVTVWATDASPDALAVARANLSGIGRAAANVHVVEGRWFDALPSELRGVVDVIVSNPPYVALTDELDAAVRVWEPLDALLAGVDGLDDVRQIVAGAPAWLRPGGWLVVEIGASQGSAVAALAGAAGLADVTVRPDLAGRDRMLVARRPV
jgi:release factor glutamine methyltransferase